MGPVPLTRAAWGQVSVMAQDVVSVSAVVWATAALGLTQWSGETYWDSLGSIGVGLGLGWLAYCPGPSGAFKRP